MRPSGICNVLSNLFSILARGQTQFTTAGTEDTVGAQSNSSLCAISALFASALVNCSFTYT
jgi:hypothetical protein